MSQDKYKLTEEELESVKADFDRLKSAITVADLENM